MSYLSTSLPLYIILHYFPQYQRQRQLSHHFHRIREGVTITYKTQLIPSDLNAPSKLIRKLFKHDILWTPDGLVFVL